MQETPSTRPLESVTDKQRLTLLVATVAGHGIKHIFNSAFFILLPEIKTGLLLSNTQVGTLSTVRNVVGGLFNLPAGFTADRFSRRRAEILGLSIALVGFFAMLLGLAPNFWVAMVASALMTAAIAFWHPAAISSLSRHFAARRGFAIALHGTGGSLGETIGPTLAGALIIVLGWRLVLQWSVIPGILLGLLVWFVLRSVPAGESAAASMKSYLRAFRQLFRNGRVLLVLLFAGGYTGGHAVVLTFLPIYLREDAGVSSVVVGLYLSLANVGGIVSQPLLGYASDRLGRKAVLAPSLTILALSTLSLYLAPPGWIFALVVLVMGAFAFPLMSIHLAAVMDLTEGGIQATAVSLVFGSAVVVSGITPTLAGILADALSVKATFLMAGGILLATALAAAVTRWQVVPAVRE
ncbi:MAG: MFS transporter [Dehalococcoidia bacterium]|jgi:FSR family fosmidomycin resistance protein-like MFS transporter|nr:MFS transporter [Dehalococcoidia bacterium]MDP7201506.1 MFS transporter [Dehalococcoidia bacterium]HJN87663.1 MFS transporter [Dehalococcoidia bacterium]